MKKVSVLLLIALIMMLLLPTQAFAASASFIISGPSTLATGETGTYTIKVTVDDAAAAQAELVYDSSFFELVSGNPQGVWDVAENTSGTYTLTTVQLKCIAGTGTTGALSLTDYKVSRLTGTNPPSEPVSCGGTSKDVSNPVPTPTATPTVAPTATPSPTPKPTATPIPTAAATSKPTVEPTETESTETTASESTPTTSETAEPSPSPLPTPEEDLDWPDVEDMLGNLASGGSLQVDMSGKPEMPVSVLVALKACNGALEIDFGDYTCRIDAKTLNDLPTGFSLLDLAVSMVRDENLSQAAGGADVYQLHFNFHGELPGLFTYTFKADASQPGDTLYLYYSYEQAGVIEGMQSAIVDQDGYVTFSFYHCSSYFVANHIVHGAMSNFVAQLPDPPAENASGIPVWVYIVCLIGVAVISVLGTMFAGRLAFFRNRP